MTSDVNPLGVSGYVMAGGMSSRMQGLATSGAWVDKALLPLSGETLLERALRKVEAACGNATILCGAEERCADLQRFGRTVSDRKSGRGPVGALDAALHDAKEPWVMLVPVDMPFLPAEAMRAFARWPHREPFVAAHFLVDSFDQPLPLLIHRSTRKFVNAAFRRGERRLLSVVREVTRECGADYDWPLLRLDASLFAEPGGGWFLNLNEPADFAEAELQARRNEFRKDASE
jgi:molybdopterin-guanine dinucleotide biosynthesis protein A